MSEDEFWSLVERTREESGGALERQTRLLREHLLTGSVEDLLEFRDRWQQAEARVFTWPVWDAACVLLGFVSDDFFSDVRAWIVSHGHVTVDRIAADPDSLVTLADDRRAAESGDAEELGMLVWSVWEELTGDCGGALPPSSVPSGGLTGDRVDLADREAVRARFPRLADVAGREFRGT